MNNFIEKKTLTEVYLQLAKSCKKKNLNLAALFYARKVLALAQDNAAGLILQSRALYDQKHYSQALLSVRESLSILEKSVKEEDQEIIAEFLSYELRCGIYTKNFEDPEKQIHDTLERLRKMKVLKPETQQSINQLEIQALDYLKTRGQRTEQELKEEAATVHEMLRKDFISGSAGQTVYILAVDWFENWKKGFKYSGYFFESESEESKNATSQSSQTTERLGYISQSSIVDDTITVFDLKTREQYSNQPIKRGLLENQDFMIISEELWEYFYSKYGGTPIPRFTFFKSPKDMKPSVEVWLQKINFILYPLPQTVQPSDMKAFDVTYISVNRTINNLIEKLHDLCKQFFTVENSKGEFYQHRLWKIDPHEDFRTLVPTFSTDRTNVISGTMLTGDTIIMDAEISEDDVLVLEYKIYPEWLFQKKEKADRKLKQNLGLDPKTMDELQVAIKEFDMSVDKEFHESSRRGICGLQNLGNTCFMNSALQCLSNTTPLTNYFLDNEFLRDLNLKNPLGAGGKLAVFYSEWIKQMWMDDARFVSPWAIKKTVGKFAPQFYGYGQQDSGELLSYLLDGLHEDLNKVKSKPLLEQIDTDGRNDEEAAKETWINHLKRNQSIIQELTHGQYKSRLDCPDCLRISITFDPFATVPLPLPMDEYSRFEVNYIPYDFKKPPVKINFSIPNEVLHSEIKSQMAKILQEDSKYFLTVLQKDQKIVEYVKEKVDAAHFRQQGYVPFIYRTSIPSTEFFSNSKGLRLLRVNVYSEAKYFFESDKVVSYARLLEFNAQNTLAQLHFEVFKKMRENLWILHQKVKSSPIIDIKQTLDSQIEKEFKIIFDLSNEKNWPYKLYFCEEELHTSKKLAKSKLIPLMGQTSLEKFAYSERVVLDSFVIEIKINSSFKWELLELNYFKEYQSTNPQDGHNREYTIYDCLALFTKREKLDKENAWYCNKCKEHKEAFKTMELYKLPEILVFHFKRFKTNRIRSIGPFYWASGNQKNTSLIEFPLTGLDMKKYTLSTNGKPVIYDLYAVSNHYGNLNGGHYTAYCKNSGTQKWYEFDDTKISLIPEKNVVSNAAYLLFYQRRESE